MRARLYLDSGFATPAGVLSVIALSLVPAPRARAGGNDPERAQEYAAADVVPKVAFACGIPLSIEYDAASLRKHNNDIRGDQNNGATECNEPLRYLWYACKSEAGKAAVKAAHISKVVCQGVPGAVGTLAVSGGALVVGRSTEERDTFLRGRKQFESLFKVSLRLGDPDPYEDKAWRAIPAQRNPVTSTTTYCLVNGEKVPLKTNGDDPEGSTTKPDVTVKCWKDSVLVTDLRAVHGKRTGFITRFYDKHSRLTTYRDGKEHGPQNAMENGELTSVSEYENGQRVWEKQLHPGGAVKRYSRKFADGYAEWAVDKTGRVQQLRCTPAARDDKVLRRPCGFDGAVTTSIYDGTGKVSRVQTWKDGVIQKEGAGDSDYAQRSDVAYVGGKKNGEEKILRKDGTRASSVTWAADVKDGRELTYSDDGKKVIKEILWKSGETKQVTEFFLNGNPRRREIYDRHDKRQVKTFWDTGKVASEGDEASCRSNDESESEYRDWCEEGVHKDYFEDGSLAREQSFRRGKRHGTTRTWHENRKPASVEEYADDNVTKARRWDKDGKLISDDEFEADGSRKLKR